MTPRDFWKPLSQLTFADVEELKDAGAREKTRVDYKEFAKTAFPMAREKLAEILASFANSGGGRIVFGAVEKDERIVRFEGADKERSGAISAGIRNAAHSVQPPVDTETVDIQIPGTEALLFVVEVKPGQRGPFQYEGRYVQRIGDGAKAMPHTSVVNAVLGTQPIRSNDYEAIPLDRPVLQGDGGDKWSCGVLLSPSYDTRRTLYDPLSDETKAIVEFLGGRNYSAVPLASKLKARHGNGWRLELWPLGHVKVVDRIDTSRATHAVGDLVFSLARFIGDAAECLFLVAPMLMVDIEIWVWSFDETPLTVEWQDAKGVNQRAAMTKHALPRTYRLNSVADLVDRDLGPNDLRYLRTESIATNAVEYIKLHMAELALPPET